MNARLIWIIVIVVVFVVAGVVGLIAIFSFALLGIMDRADSHVCGLAAVRRSPAAAALVGTPIVQHGFTGGSSSSDNGELSERVTFTVAGPLGQAFVVSEGRRSPLASHLVVRIGRDQQQHVVYDGPFDCPELHARTR